MICAKHGLLLFIYLYIYLFICLLLCLITYLFVYLFIYLFIYFFLRKRIKDVRSETTVSEVVGNKATIEQRLSDISVLVVDCFGTIAKFKYVKILKGLKKK